jgi:molecular chaperone DnaK (HSP70)
MKAIGIDLGATNTVAAIVEKGRPRALINRDNEVLSAPSRGAPAGPQVGKRGFSHDTAQRAMGFLSARFHRSPGRVGPHAKKIGLFHVTC